ncbi:hypothetical protein K9M59_04470 [Candidatus Gracilibacteria bacterium]|nr:hypothetical protein [Candidatus Gracilibacteria bacterium]MCF7819574.1 hypothetical protein [Candidatus Gracilibacteria bacterium]
MKKYILLGAALFFLSGCDGTNPDENPDSLNVSGDPIQTQKLGEECGGPLGKKCASGLECKKENPRPESFGVCVEIVVDETLKCEPTKDPVCGQKGNTKNGYLNECEARRHGAEVLHKGFCIPDTNVVGNCDASIMGIGNCEAYFEGFEFDGTACIRKGVSGCDAEIPFDTLEDCQEKCE